MFKIDDITGQVLKNCDISDSQHAGLYSICGLALRLRDLYKWENRLNPWVEKDPSEVLKWIGDKEEAWERLAERNFHDIIISGKQFDPFDAKAINTVLEPRGVIYGAGYARSLKPTFFLAEIESKEEKDGCTIYILGRELARDLQTIPALSQDDYIYVRQESAKLFLWDQIFYIKKSGRSALRFGLKNYGLKEQTPQMLHFHFDRIAEAETGKYVYHELGEIHDTVFDRNLWREIVAAFPHTPIELLVRTIKDLLADTNKYGTLYYIIRERNAASLGFYVAFLETVTKKIFPQIIDAFQEFTTSYNWQTIEKAVASGYHASKSIAQSIIRIYLDGRQRKDMKWVENEIARQHLSQIMQ